MTEQEKKLPKATAENYNEYCALKQKCDDVCKLIDENGSDSLYYEIEAERAVDAYKASYDWFDAPFEENGKMGSKDIFGKVRVPAVFDEVGEFYSYAEYGSLPYAPVKKDGKWGLVRRDGTGKTFLDFDYDYASFLPDHDYYIVKQNGLCGLVGKDGLLVPCCFDTIYQCINNITEFSVNGKYGLLTRSGLFVKPIYDEIETELDDFCHVVLNGKKGFLDENGDFTEDEEKASVGAFISDELA